MDADMASKGATQAADDQLGKLAGSLLESLNKGGAEFIETPLEQLYHYFREKTWKKSSSDAFLQTWSACALLLDEDLNPEVCARALHILRSLAQFCIQCGNPVFQDYSQLHVGTLVGRIAACIQRYPQSITLQTSACALISRLTGCSPRLKANAPEIVADINAAIAVQALAQTLTSLQANPSVPAAMVCASEALAALRFIADIGPAQVDLVAEAGGVQLIDAAREIAQGQGHSDVHVLFLMSHLACRPQATFLESLAASTISIDAAQRVCNSMPPSSLPEQVFASQNLQQDEQESNIYYAVRSIAESVQALVSRQDVNHAALAEFTERSAAVAIAYLKQPNLDSANIGVWVLLLCSLLGCVKTLQSGSASMFTVTSPETAFVVANEVFNKTQGTGAQHACMLFLWELLFYCQPLDSTQSKTLAQILASAITTLNKNFVEERPIPAEKIVVAGTMAHVLACIGLLGHTDVLSPAQASLTMITAMSELKDTRMSRAIGNTEEEWDSMQVDWEALSTAVRTTVDILLAAGPAALNASYDAEGFTLVHHLAAYGQSKCLEVVLESSGDALDLLARTKSGATALQLARQGRHTAAAGLLEEVTQLAAEARQSALLEELEAADKDDSARKAKKKKSVTRSASFAADQPDEKSQKTEVATAPDQHHHQHNSATNDTIDNTIQNVENASTANAASAAEQARVELRQRLEEEYERALEERRMELAKQQQQQFDDITTTTNNATTTAATGRDTSMAINSEDSSSAENPSTPRAMLEAGISAGNGGSGGAGSGSNSNSGAEEDLMMVGPATTTTTATPAIEIDAAVPAPGAVSASTAAVGGSFLRRTPSELSPFTSPDLQLLGNRADLGSMAINANTDGVFGGAGAGGSIHREHSLFGSPSLTGNLFGSYGSGSPGFSTGLHASSPGASTGLLNNNGSGASNGVFGGNGLSNEASGQLPDALFIHHGLTAEDINKLDNSNNTNANLLASLVGNTRTTMSSPSSQSHVVPQMNSAYGQRVPSVGGHTTGTGSGSSDGDSDASTEPTRHLWIGNLGTRTPRAVLKAVFEAYGVVEDVVTFPGRMYAFVNYCTTDEAVQATAVLQNQIVAELTGDRPLLLKYRPVKKAEMHLRSLGSSMLDSDLNIGLVSSAMGGGHGFGSSGGLAALASGGSSLNLNAMRSGLVGSGNMMMMSPGLNPFAALNDPDGNCSDPSPRIWLGNIAPTATSKTLQAVLSRFGPLTDAAVFPARIGPLGYAFVKFEALEDAVRALETLNNTVVPPLSGSKQLKMRYKPAASGPAGREESIESDKSARVPSRHLWLGNITQKPSEDIIFQAFSKFGRVDSARVFPAKAYAFVNYSDINAAIRAMAELEGVCIPCLTGVKPLVMRFQQENQQQPTGPPPLPLPSAMRASASLANMAGVGLAGGAFAAATNNPHMSRVQSDSALAFAASLNQLVPGGSGLSDDLVSHPHGGLVGVVPNTNNSNGGHGGSWGPEQAAAMHRSASLKLLSQAARGNAIGAGTPASTPYTPNLLGQMPDSHSMGSASTSQLSAVLNNLAALQRAASAGGVAPGAHQDIASLSTMLASQSLASHDAAMPMRSSIAGWNNGGAGVGVGGTSGSVVGLDGLLCPLSKQLMTDPVVAADGVTYHRPAISEWMGSQTISPVLQTPLPHGGLVPNHAVKDAVLGYLRMQLQVAV